MKRGIVLFTLFLLSGLVAFAKSLPLSPSAAAESKLYEDFVEVLLTEKTNPQQVCALYEDVLAQAPQSKLLRRQVLLCALTEQDMSKADQYASFIEEGENDAEDLAAYAYYQLRKGDIASARNYYEQAMQKDPDDLRILQQYFLLLSLIDIDSAAKILQERKKEYPGQTALLDYETGQLYFKAKQYPVALQYFKSATQEDPSYVEPYLARADVYEKTNQYFLMLHELEEAEKLGYQAPRMFDMMGTVYLLGKDHARAREYFMRAKKLAPADSMANYFLALYAEQLDHDYAQAATYLRQSADYPEKAERWLQVSFYQQQVGDQQGALQTLKEGYEHFDKNVELGYFYALLLSDMKQSRQAAKVLEEILQTNPQYDKAREVYAFALEDLGKYKKMEEQVRLVLEHNARNAAMYNLLGYSLAKRGVRLDEAEQYIIKALEISPRDNSFIDSLAWLYYQKGEYNRALSLLQSVPETFLKSDPEGLYHLGAAYAAVGETEKARPYLQQAAASVKEAAKLLKKLPAAKAGLADK